MTQRRRLMRGYTIVELMLSIAVLSIGAAGIITMQRVTAESGRHAKSLAAATHIAQSWLDELIAEASLWNSDFSQAPYLAQSGTTGWFPPEYIAARNWGAAFDPKGSPLPTADQAESVFCVNLRFQQMYPARGALVDGVPSTGAGLLRAEVRVFWLRDSIPTADIDVPAYPCEATPGEVSDPTAPQVFHFVHMSTTLLQHSL